MARYDPELRAHLDWLGLLQPYGLVVSAPALVHAGVVHRPNDLVGQEQLESCVEERVYGPYDETEQWLPDFEEFARTVLGWNFSPKAYAGPAACAADDSLVVPLPDFGEVLKPDYAVRHWPPPDDGQQWQLLVRILGPDQEFDAAERGSGTLDATAQGRMERLMRSTGVRAGLLFNGRAVRLVSAPHGENSGWMDFKVAEMLVTAGRPIVGALRMLLSQCRLLTVSQNTRLTELLAESRKYQNVVSERLAEQVLHALYELLRGFQAADDSSHQVLLTQPLKQSPDMVYRAMLTAILRLIFLLYVQFCVVTHNSATRISAWPGCQPTSQRRKMLDWRRPPFTASGAQATWPMPAPDLFPASKVACSCENIAAPRAGMVLEASGSWKEVSLSESYTAARQDVPRLTIPVLVNRRLMKDHQIKPLGVAELCEIFLDFPHDCREFHKCHSLDKSGAPDVSTQQSVDSVVLLRIHLLESNHVAHLPKSLREAWRFRTV